VKSGKDCAKCGSLIHIQMRVCPVCNEVVKDE